ncbi:hypothetical protein [Nonlabens sp. Asnod2-A12]|uniref:hypothetical protein n=1 Tax=Nonlabens sp. Asnod2-A12 TaxID=3160578 RepID=UPI00386BF6E7
MKTFEEIQNSWSQNKEPIDEALLPTISNRVNRLKNKNRITIAVLIATVAVLVAYLIWVGYTAPVSFYVGLFLMVGSIAYRVIAELFSTQKLAKIALDNSYNNYKSAIEKYYRSRLILHKVLTPIILVVYWLGFIMLIPTFKENLSHFWFNYTWISSIPIAIAMLFFIRYYIKKEQVILDKLYKETSIS